MTVFSTEVEDPTKLTEDEYLELVNCELLKTPIYTLMKEVTKGQGKAILKFLVYLRDNQPSLLKTYNLNR